MREITVREAIGNAIAEEMRRDPDVFIMGEEIGKYQGAYKVTQGLLQEFGERRVIDTPISEHGFTGIAIGAAFAGLRPILEFMSFNFSLQAMDQIVNSAAKTHYMSDGQLRCPIVFRGPNGAAAQVAAQHSQCFAAWYSHIPGLKVIAPYFASDYRGLLKSAIRDNNPVIFLENEILYGMAHTLTPEQEENDYTVPIGKANVIKEGSDVTIVTFSICVKLALEAAEILANENNIDVEIIDLRTLRPLDFDTVLKSLSKTNKLITVEEGFPVLSFGSEISARIMEEAFDLMDAPIIRVASKDTPLPYARNLEKLVLPQVSDVVEAVRSVVLYKI
ncbi:transketolase, pyrimidine binding domain protein [Neorickettsia helminthoeca str. Oregon]|uniref:Pyruvate dehydrogenase E1 component subunit beta n=1 Tax=Neorickettsia helminthoeca str. Oregon TaxID=1286528 RepID=X5H4L6_9RICK|nr:pyruvate dehydrogenase complex E1 component subunit beta [Neorickettsia helminthoeca]AHX11643.1 transketolase, pyrimidine binding domain protein [Neorickettsia helminthoeca str. Oregon]